MSVDHLESAFATDWQAFQRGLASLEAMQAFYARPVTANFTYGEFFRKTRMSDLTLLGDNGLMNIRALAQSMQMFRSVLRKPIIITSGWRSPAHNQRVGGAVNSLHLKGSACDFTVNGFSIRRAFDTLKPLMGEYGSELIAYPKHLHFGLKDYRQPSWVDGNGVLKGKQV